VICNRPSGEYYGHVWESDKCKHCGKGFRKSDPTHSSGTNSVLVSGVNALLDVCLSGMKFGEAYKKAPARRPLSF